MCIPKITLEPQRVHAKSLPVPASATFFLAHNWRPSEGSDIRQCAVVRIDSTRSVT